MKQIDFAKKYYITKDGKVFSSTTGNLKELTQKIERQGYKRLRIKCNDGKGRSFLVHRLVALMLIPNPNNKPFVNHIDGDKQNNLIENLEWVTGKENLEHAFSIGLKSNKGISNPRVLLSEEDVISIHNRLLDCERTCDLAREFNVKKSTINNIKIGKNWKELLQDLPKIPTRPKNDKLSESTVKWICHNLQNGVGVSEIIKQSSSKLSEGVVYDIKRRRCHVRISKDFIW